jgi:hypothetical protein
MRDPMKHERVQARVAGQDLELAASRGVAFAYGRDVFG